MIYMGNIFPKGGDILGIHSLDNNEGKGSFSKFIHQNILTHYSVNITGQVSQHIVIDPRHDHTDQGRDQ